MSVLLYLVLIALLIPLQSMVLPYLTLWGVKPDLGFIVVCLAGLFGGELEGLLVGLAMGLTMNLFSAGDVIFGMITKGGVGYLAGLAGRQVVYLSPSVLVLALLAVSCTVGLLTAFTVRFSVEQDLWWALKTVVVPQACYDAAIGGALYWLIWNRLDIERWVSEYRA